MTTEPEDPAMALVAAATVVQMAATLGCPRLAVRAARRCTRLASAMQIQLSPLLARVSTSDEEARLDGVRVIGDLAALLHPATPDDDDDRAGAS